MGGAYARALGMGMAPRIATVYALGYLEAQLIQLTAYRSDDTE